MTTYGGYDLLMIAPNAVSAWTSTRSRDTEGTANANGNVIVTTTAAPSVTGERQLTWNCVTRAELVALETFLGNRKGRFAACWIPTYQRDIEVVNVVPFYGTVVRPTPASDLLATIPAWRYWFSRTTRGALYATHYWDISTDPLDGTNVWTTSPGAGPTNVSNVVDPFSVTTANGYMHSRLLLCRLTDDHYTVDYLTGSVTTVTATFVEVPAEVP